MQPIEYGARRGRRCRREGRRANEEQQGRCHRWPEQARAPCRPSSCGTELSWHDVELSAVFLLCGPCYPGKRWRVVAKDGRHEAGEQHRRIATREGGHVVPQERRLSSSLILEVCRLSEELDFQAGDEFRRWLRASQVCQPFRDIEQRLEVVVPVEVIRCWIIGL